MNIFIFPTDDRSGQTALIYHYSKLGHKVFIAKHGTLGLNWSRIATWPGLLCKNTSNPSVRNIEIHKFERNNDQLFGEDYFLNSIFDEKLRLYNQNITCELIDLEKENPGIDVFHTLRGGENYLKQYFEIANKYFPNAKWVSSTFNCFNITPGNYNPTNAAKFIPANYENNHTNINNVCLMATDFEMSLLKIHKNLEKRTGFASFNHNFEQRQPGEYFLFSKMNDILQKNEREIVPNYGGNIRTQGADIRYSETNGITGQFKTLTVKEAYTLTTKLKALVLFKQTDWGGGCFYSALNSETPIITTHSYVKVSNSSKFIINKFNAIIVNDANEAANIIMQLNNDQYCRNLQIGMQKIKNEVFNDNYWENWEKFLKRLV